MLPTPAVQQGIVRRLLERIGNPLEWSAADRCQLVAIPVGLYLLSFELFFHYMPMFRPDLSAPDLETIALLNRGAGWLLAGWLALALAALLLRRRFRDARLWDYLSTQGWAITFGATAYAFGPTTSPTVGFSAISGVIAGPLLYGWLPTLTSITVFALIAMGGEVASYAGVLPYAPAFKLFAVKDGRLTGAWLLTTWLLVWSIVILCMAIFGYIFYRWRDREEQLAEAQVLLSASNERLQTATGLIRRYVPTQLAEQILSGQYVQGGKWERRKLTLFFSDIKGFTDASDELEAEDLSRVLNEYLLEMSLIADRHGATLDKFVGDAIMIFFGAPAATSDKDHALRAVRMATDMQARMGELRQKWLGEGIENPFQIRIGINTGVATVGNFGSEGRMDYTAIGKQVNLAARLESNCEPGKILISHATWALIKDEVPCADKGEIHVKGIHHPIRTYEVR